MGKKKNKKKPKFGFLEKLESVGFWTVLTLAFAVGGWATYVNLKLIELDEKCDQIESLKSEIATMNSRIVPTEDRSCNQLKGDVIVFQNELKNKGCN